MPEEEAQTPRTNIEAIKGIMHLADTIDWDDMTDTEVALLGMLMVVFEPEVKRSIDAKISELEQSRGTN